MHSLNLRKSLADQPSTAAEDRLRLLIDTVPILNWTALPDGSINFINQRGLVYHGLTLEDVQGWGWTVALHPEDRGRFVDERRAALAAGVPFESQGRLRSGMNCPRR